jgi:uncharacterized protein
MKENSAAVDGAWDKRFGGAAVVTGASSGIGEAFAWALAARGMDLVLVALEHDLLVTLAAEIEAKHGVRAALVATDLARPDTAEVVRDAADAAGLTVGLLINCAGFGLFGPFTELNAAGQANMIDVNCRAPMSLARMFAPGMKDRGRGGIIFVASTAAYQPTPYMATYAATKVFDLFMAEALWAELGEHGVEVLALSPGHVRTAFQARCGDPIHNPPGGVSTPDQIVAAALAALGQKPSVIPGLRNVVMSRFTRLMPRKAVMRGAIRYFEQLDPARSSGKTEAPTRSTRPAMGNSRFVGTMARMLATFLAVAFIDLVVGSLITHKLRFWFPLWIDPQWETSSTAWVVYSQSYAAGIVLMPVLAAAVLREFVPKASRRARHTFIAGTVALLGFIAWWKGGLMFQHHKEQEALAWIVLTGTIWGLIRYGEKLQMYTAGVSPRQLATGIARGLAVFFLVMAVLDPLLTVGVQGLPWSQGLFIEMGFFVPAGLALLALTSGRRLERAVPTGAEAAAIAQVSNPARSQTNGESRRRVSWFDQQFSSNVEQESVENLLNHVANSPRVIQAVKAALAQHDEKAKQPGWYGPSRTQAIREALAGVLGAED